LQNEGEGEIMKNATLTLLLLLLITPAVAAPTPDDYTIDVHVSSSYFGAQGQILKVTINGKKYKLSATPSELSLLALGDYKAKLIRDDHKASYYSYQIYEFQFPDKKTRKFNVIGQSE